MQDILSALQASNCCCDIDGLHGGSTALLLAQTRILRRRTVCCIVPNDSHLEILARDIALFTDSEILLYPSFEIPPYAPLAPDPATVATRLATVYRLLNETDPCILLCSAEAVLRRILPAPVLEKHCELLIAGEETDRDQLITDLAACGYQHCAMVKQEGDMAVRGSIIDVYCPPSTKAFSGPLRLDFFGDTVESIRVFDPVSQRSIQELEEAVLLPASDILFPPENEKVIWRAHIQSQTQQWGWPDEERDAMQEQLFQRHRFSGIEFCLPLLLPPPLQAQSIFAMLPRDTLLAVHDPPAVKNQIRKIWGSIAANHEETRDSGRPMPPPEALFLTPKALESHLNATPSVHFCQLPDPDSSRTRYHLPCSPHTLLRQEIELQRRKAGQLSPLIERLKRWHDQGEQSVLACHSNRQLGHFAEILKNFGIPSRIQDAPLQLSSSMDQTGVQLVQGILSRGFDLEREKIHILSTAELFGERRIAGSSSCKKSTTTGPPLLVEELHSGDLVVHRDHGLGVFLGLFNMEFGGQQGDFMQIEYRGGDKLYVPVDKLHRVGRYQGLSDQQPRLDQLGSSAWQNTKKKVSEAVWKVAQELLEIYAQRAIREGHAFLGAGELYQGLEESFPYEETEGQRKAIDETLADMMNGRPMDRLICGDVGYGKTEVAMRAAIKAIEDGFQVAILVPTTVLAEQHAASFRERFSTFPVRSGCLNRFRTPAQQRIILAELESGSLDLVVGTHRLLSKDVVFKRLGLLIVDEEHRFGVSHKERLKKLRAEVDVLTLTATPIPRTLQMSLLGIRDLSVISSPPRQRRSIKTFLARFDDLVIREAISRELQRGGQVFFVHNRIESIHAIADRVQRLVPGTRIGIAHGQMPGPHLEEIMASFINHDLDVLVCTTIIESGLDIPNANTIIINRADHLGLADIYQLRGRVGRGSRQAYAYLLVPSLDELTGDAQERLRALMDASELGSGFKLAMNDLQIRGGGNLLGVSQSGHIAAVGYDLYLELLQATVADLKEQGNAPGCEEEPPLDPEIKLQLPAFLPQDYVPDVSQRYHLYRRISLASNGSPEDLAVLAEEIRDRYGRIPVEGENLLATMQRKFRLRELGITKLEQGPDSLIYSFITQSPVSPEVILRLIQKKPGKGEKAIRLTPDSRLIVPLRGREPVFDAIDRLLGALA